MLAAAILFGTPFAAAAQEQPPMQLDPNSPVAANPISLDRVQIQPGTSVSIDFTNGYVVPATQIVFALSNAAGRRSLLSDAGYYERGQHVEYTFQDADVANADRVVVESANFADGSSWTRPEPSETMHRNP
jgi:hypothetical protein